MLPAPGARENKVMRQVACDCGYWALFFMEDESRRKRGEGKWATRYDLAYRVGLLRGIAKRLKPAEAREKDRQKAALEKEKSTRRRLPC